MDCRFRSARSFDHLDLTPVNRPFIYDTFIWTCAGFPVFRTLVSRPYLSAANGWSSPDTITMGFRRTYYYYYRRRRHPVPAVARTCIILMSQGAHGCTRKVRRVVNSKTHRLCRRRESRKTKSTYSAVDLNRYSNGAYYIMFAVLTTKRRWFRIRIKTFGPHYGRQHSICVFRSALKQPCWTCAKR